MSMLIGLIKMNCFSQPIIFIVILKICLGLVLLWKLNLCSFPLFPVYSGKFVVKEKKNNPKLAVNIMHEIKKKKLCTRSALY